MVHQSSDSWRHRPLPPCEFAAASVPWLSLPAWLILAVSGMLETMWAIALERTQGFTKLMPSIVFVVALALSMSGLGYALRELPVGTGYAVWVGIGAVGAAVVGMIGLGESASLVRIGCLLLVVAGIVGLKVFN
ncbi:MAG TPA: ligand-binding protein SH3 [Candidatus Stackebrandtia faecavium]|nr:ligand-binding protein SH3 [Candidatus Stackebrandtia faecavium]